MRSFEAFLAEEVLVLQEAVPEIKHIHVNWLKGEILPNDRIELAGLCGRVQRRLDVFIDMMDVGVSKTRKGQIIRAVNETRNRVRKLCLEELPYSQKKHLNKSKETSKKDLQRQAVGVLKKMISAYFDWDEVIPETYSEEWFRRRHQILDYSNKGFGLAGINSTSFRRVLECGGYREMIQRVFGEEYDIDFSQRRMVKDWSTKESTIKNIRDGVESHFSWEGSVDPKSECGARRREQVLTLHWRLMSKLGLTGSFTDHAGAPKSFNFYADALVGSFPEYDLGDYEFKRYGRNLSRYIQRPQVIAKKLDVDTNAVEIYLGSSPEEQTEILNKYVNTKFSSKKAYTSGLQYEHFVNGVKAVGLHLPRYGFDLLWDFSDRYARRTKMMARYFSQQISADGPLGNTENFTLLDVTADPSIPDLDAHLDLDSFMDSLPPNMKRLAQEWAEGNEAELPAEIQAYVLKWRDQHNIKVETPLQAIRG